MQAMLRVLIAWRLLRPARGAHAKIGKLSGSISEY
jgi:hypothetical protein